LRTYAGKEALVLKLHLHVLLFLRKRTEFLVPFLCLVNFEAHQEQRKRRYEKKTFLYRPLRD
jgi:hypothetical protein